MTDTSLCDDKEQLVAYLFDELDGLGRHRIEEHLRVCGACAAELEGLAGVRRELARWAPPEAQLGFRITRAPALTAAAESPARGSWGRVPAWAQVAAAVLVASAALGVANLQVRYGPEGMSITTGWMAASAPGRVPAPADAAQPTPASDTAAWQPALAALETTLRQEIREARTSRAGAEAAAPARAAEVPMQRVADLIAQSERRQTQELALRLAQFGRELEVQRRSDLVRVNQGFGQFEGRAGAEIARQRQMLDYIMRVSAQPPPK